MRSLLLLSILSLGSAAPAGAATEPALERIVDEALAGPIRDRLFSGAVLVEKDGRTLLRKGYGLADRALGSPNLPETGFMIMSVSKQLTAALILRLAARGRLRLDEPVGTYLDGWPAEWAAVTIHHLLSHSAGTDIDTTYFWLVEHHPRYWPHPAEEPPRYEPCGLLTTPGTTFLYANVGYTLLSMIAERAGGMTFDQLLREEVLCPIGMDHTEPERRGRVAGRARGYRRTGEGFELDEQETIDIVGAGDLVSTVDDLAAWNRALLDDRFLPASLRTPMLTPHVRGSRSGLGYGWFLRTGEDGRPLHFHTGGGAGFRAYNYRMPDAGLTVVLLSNVAVEDSTWAFALLARIAAATS